MIIIMIILIFITAPSSSLKERETPPPRAFITFFEHLKGTSFLKKFATLKSSRPSRRK
jgi:hypothetical protein